MLLNAMLVKRIVSLYGVHICVCTCMYVYMYVHTHVCVRVYECAYVRVMYKRQTSIIDLKKKNSNSVPGEFCYYIAG